MDNPLKIELRRRIEQDAYSTAYPWRQQDWAQFLNPGPLKFKKYGRISFYIHIPFCKNLCSFCEYTRCLLPDENTQRNYLRILEGDINRFLTIYSGITLEGFDIGGGTPTALSDDNFAYLMQIYKGVVGRVHLSEDFEPSIETSIQTISPRKISMIRDAGINRISAGIQSLYFSRDKEAIGWQYPQADEIIRRINDIRGGGDFKLNLDFMYGFKFQGTHQSMTQDQEAILQLNPNQVTLYELRTNQLAGVVGSSSDRRTDTYNRWYDMLEQLGYRGKYGQNTFSTDPSDFGVSSYIRQRMLNGGDYKGFGISAQSMAGGNVEYNKGKNANDILSLIPSEFQTVNASFEATEHYDLPRAEKFAKFVCISAYSGGFDWRIVRRRFYPDFFERFKDVIDFLKGEGYIEITERRVQVTIKGFAHYGAIFSLFYKKCTGNRYDS